MIDPILIPVLALSIPIVVIWTRHKQKMAELEIQITAEKAAQDSTRNTELENRVRVLERIITDKTATLAAQIEDLREPAN